MTTTRQIRIPGSRTRAIVVGEVTNHSRGWAAGLTPLCGPSSALDLHPARALASIMQILLLTALAALPLASASSAGQRRSAFNLRLSTCNLQLATCNLGTATCKHGMQGQQPSTWPMHESIKSPEGVVAGQERQEAPGKDQLQRPDSSHSHQDHEGMNQRGNAGMEFDQEKATHHFRLLPQGGAIEVETRDASDTTSRDQIRAHLSRIAEMFKTGDFSIPMFVHDQAPPGVETMKVLKEAIIYKYKETSLGGRVEISTTDPQAIEAIHSFLRFQIREHRTRDSLEVVQ